MRRHLSGLLIVCGCVSANGADIAVVGVTHDKAILSIDGGNPRGYAIGSMLDEDTRLVAVDRDGISVEVHKRRYQIPLGQAGSQVLKSTGGNASVVLNASERGHFVANAQINGVSMKMLVDTGASLITLGSSEAARIGINYRNGQRSQAQTANGMVNTFLVKLDTVKIGGVELHQVDAAIIENSAVIPLLGMSFLKRMDIRQEGDSMTLTRRY